MSKLRVAIIGDAISSRNGGCASFTDFVLAAERSFDVSVFTPAGRLDKLLYAHPKFDDIRSCVRPVPVNLLCPRFRLISKKRRIINSLATLAQKKSADLHLFDLILDFVGVRPNQVREWRASGIKVLRMHNGSVKAFIEYFGDAPKYSIEANQKNYLQTMRSYDGLMFQSQEQLHETMKQVGEEVTAILLEPTCDEDYLQKFKTKPKVASDTKHKQLVQIGSIQPRKNQLESLEILKSLNARGNSCSLLVVGSEQDQTYVSKLKQYIVDNGLTYNVELVGFQSNYAKILAASDALLIPSTAEGVPRVLREAFFVGTPVVAKVSTGFRSLIESGAVCAFELGSLEALLSDKLTCDGIRSTAKKYYHRHFSRELYDAAIRKLVESYK